MLFVIHANGYQGLRMNKKSVGLLGATSLVGDCLLPLLMQDGSRVIAFSRRGGMYHEAGVEWRQLGQCPSDGGSCIDAKEVIDTWIAVAPIWVLPDHFSLLEAYGPRRVVALSSTSRFTKGNSSDPDEQDIARRLAEGENALRIWAEARGVEWVILRPTLIYGRGRDRNITEIARFISRFGFFPLFGQAKGLRQPVHAEDVAQACLAALKMTGRTNRTYNLSGGETLTYRELVRRVFAAMECHPRLLTVPHWVFLLAITTMRLLPRYRHWTVAMAERMNHDLIFDASDAMRDLGFSPRLFQLKETDLIPVKSLINH